MASTLKLYAETPAVSGYPKILSQRQQCACRSQVSSMLHLKPCLWFSYCLMGCLAEGSMAWHGTSFHNPQPHAVTQHLARRNMFPTVSFYPIHCLENPPAQHQCSGFNSAPAMAGEWVVPGWIFLAPMWTQSIPTVLGNRLFASWTCFSTWAKDTSIKLKNVSELPFPKRAKVKPLCGHPLQHWASPSEGRQTHTEFLGPTCCCGSTVEPNSCQLCCPERS